MKSKAIYRWRSDEKILEDRLGIRHDENVFRSTLKEFNGRRTRMMLRTGKEINAILVASDKYVLSVQAVFDGTKLTGDISLIPLKEIITVGVANGN